MLKPLAVALLYSAIAGKIFAAESEIFAQVVDGGGWQTTFVLTNRHKSSDGFPELSCRHCRRGDAGLESTIP